MSGGYIEGRQVTTKATAIPLTTGEYGRHIKDATRGSLLLRDAILLAKGITPPKTFSTIAKVALCPMCRAPYKPTTMIANIQAVVCAYYGLSPLHMVSAERGRRVARPRQVAMYLARELSGKSLPEIGRRFGDRDHTTVMHAIKVVEERMFDDAEILLDVEALRERLSS